MGVYNGYTFSEEWKDEAKRLLKKHEGLRLKPYKDSQGYLTIGYGRCLDIKGISVEEAEVLFENDFEEALQHCLMACSAFKIDFDGLPDKVKIALVNMAFNLGHKLLSFKRMLAAIANEDFKEAAEEALDSLWAEQVGERAEEIAELFLEAL